MNSDQLRQTVKTQWLTYYRENRHWLTRLAVWVDYRGQRRPTSSFILATLSTLNPNLPHLLPLIVELSNDPDRIVAALGLNFNPEDELQALDQAENLEVNGAGVKMLPPQPKVPPIPSRMISRVDETCHGSRNPRSSSPAPTPPA